MDISTVRRRSRPDELWRNTSIQVKLLVLTLGMLSLLLGVTIATNLYALQRFEHAVSQGRLSQEHDLIEARLAAAQTELKEQATALALTDSLLAAVVTGDRNAVQRQAVQLLVAFQLDYMLIVDQQGQLLFGNQQLGPDLADDLDLALLTFEQTEVSLGERGALITAAVPIKDATSVRGAILIGHQLDNAVLRQLNSNRSDPVLQVIAPEVGLLAASTEDAGGPDEPVVIDQATWQRVRDGGPIVSSERGSNGVAQHVLIARVSQSDAVPVLLRITLSAAEIHSFRHRTVQQSVTGLLLIGLLSSLALTIVLRRGIVRPMRRLSEAAEQLGAGNPFVMPASTGHDEIGQLTNSFRTMADRLGQTMAQLEAQNQLLQQEIAEHRRTAAANAELENAVVVAEETILEMSTPLIPIDNQTLVMPLVGVLNPHRSRQVLATLLSGVAERRATLVILDVTGVPMIDAEVAGHIVQVVHAARMLGAEANLTGVRPEVAQSLIGLGVDLGGIMTYATLQHAVAASRCSLPDTFEMSVTNIRGAASGRGKRTARR